jgi:hypothetical protein
MDTANAGQGLRTVFKLVFIVGAVIALYYLYQYLFVRAADKSVTIFQPVKNVNQVQALVKTSDTFPPLMEGGEYSASFWMYVQNWGARAGYNKHILSIGAPNNGFYTLVAYLGANTNTLHIRLQASDIASGSGPSAIPALTNKNVADMFDKPVVGTPPSSAGFACDIPNIELQRWILVNIVLNGNSVDVYIDGKLARSVVAPSFYRVPSGGYQLTAHGSDGFGGYMSNLQLSSVAMNPEEANRMYQAGPVGISSFLEWLKSFFDPNAMENMLYPKMN